MSNKIKVTENYLERVVCILKELRNGGTFHDLYEADKLIANTKHYLKNTKKETKEENK